MSSPLSTASPESRQFRITSMSDFITLKGCPFDAKVLANVRKISPTRDWTVRPAAMKKLRDELMKFQCRRCAYCQGPIEADANGYREIEHVLPKSADGDQTRAYSANFSDRTETAGYNQFKFEPLNLILICKQCNSSKGTFDPFGPRDKISPIQYPNEVDFEWFHPHFHRYGDHITRTPEWTFIHKTPQGDFTIRACKLDLPEQLEKRFLARAMANLEHSDSLRDALNLVCASLKAKYYGMTQAADALYKHCKLPLDEGKALIQLWSERQDSDKLEVIAKAQGALESFSAIWPNKQDMLKAVETLNT